jgi:replicative DNA helicase Mcm
MTGDKVEEAIKAIEEETETNVETYWVRHLKRNNAEEIDNIVNSYPKSNVLNIDAKKILNNTIWKKVIENPSGCSDDIRQALRFATSQPEEKWKLHDFRNVIVRYNAVSKRKKIRELRQSDERKLIGIKSLVRRVSPVRPKVVLAFFQCDSGHITEVIAQQDKIHLPKHCSMVGCDLRTFGHLDKRDRKVDRQWLYIQDPLEDLTDGGQPEFLKCEVLEDLCGAAVAGDRIVINGQYRSIPVWKGGVLTTAKDVYFDTSSIEFEEREFQDIKITGEDEKRIIALSKSENLFNKMAKSIAPSIIGMGMLKQAIILMLFEGVTKKLKDGTSNRGHINILAVSDPSMAKTKLLRFVASIAPRGVFTNATTSTKVGLVAPIVRDETTGEYTVQAGAYMIASGGVLCLDEVSELDKGDFKYLNEAMEDGEAHITKGGLNITVKTRASLLAACNPINGSFDPNINYADQVKIPESTLSRFDLKIIMLDVQSEAGDSNMIEQISKNNSEELDMEDFIEPELLRKYIAYARKIRPKLTKAATKAIEEYYVEIRKLVGNGDTMKVTPRQAMACFRLAEAHAKMRLSETVILEDAKAAMDLFNSCLYNLATDARTGKPNLAMTDHKTNRKNTIAESIIEIIKSGITSELAIVTTMEERRYTSARVMSAIRTLKDEGVLIEKKAGVYGVM